MNNQKLRRNDQNYKVVYKELHNNKFEELQRIRTVEKIYEELRTTER